MDGGRFELGEWERRELGNVVGEAEENDTLQADERDRDELADERPHELLTHLKGAFVSRSWSA